MIKLLALDLDGTLLNSEKKISRENKVAIRSAIKKGIKVVLCTGRPLMGIQQYVDELQLIDPEDFSITYNGGLVQRNHNGEVLSQKTLSYKDIQEIYALSQELEVPMNILDLNYVYEPTYPPNRPSLYPSLQSASLPFVKCDIDSFSKEQQFNKVVFCAEPTFLDNAISKIPVEFYQRFSTMKSRPLLFEMMHPEVNKGSGIAQLCHLLNITSDQVMVCGDEENDLAMLEYAGVAVAMANASEAVKKAATFITKSNDNHGVAYAIQHYINE